MKSFAVELLYRYKMHMVGPPFSPLEYANLLDVEVEYGDIEAEGVFIDHPKDGARIVLRKQRGYLNNHKLRRINFTLAHEIGHYVIRKALKGFISCAELSTEDAEEELLCNIFAAELLMPSSVISEDLKKFGLDPEALTTLCDRYEVSLQSLLCCVTRIVQGEIVALLWEKDDNQFSVCWSSPSSYRDLILCDTGSTTVERAFMTEEQQSGADTLMHNGKRMRWLSVSQKLVGTYKTLTIMRRGFRSPYRFMPVKEPASSLSHPMVSVPTQMLLPVEPPKQLSASMTHQHDWDEMDMKSSRRPRTNTRRSASIKWSNE
ncbi:MAG TPA: ImmA/IrrE family metallo-endopeptidase [Pyrinomonadaceae bacterium]|nr:ImmA/IrrE family metallo-endopeptidase [Pyrinomonadaceae bacterium]